MISLQLKNRNFDDDNREWIEIITIPNPPEFATLVSQHGDYSAVATNLARAISLLFEVPVRLKSDEKDIIIDEF